MNVASRPFATVVLAAAVALLGTFAQPPERGAAAQQRLVVFEAFNAPG